MQWKEKNIEILNRMRSYLNSYDNSEMPTKNELEQGFIEQLKFFSRKKEYKDVAKTTLSLQTF